ncbi:MAG: YicC family protein [Candidatus Omnitrophica bacterium]|nr:YicC family protein [Candidatus Omnitrophota bacterium]
MIKGMTGFGSAQFVWGKIRVVVEVKSLNHRYFDIAYYLPGGFSSIENKIQQLAQRHIERGRVTVSVKIAHKPTQEIVLNKDIVRKYLRYAQELSREFRLENDLRISDIVRLPGTVETRESFLDPVEAWPTLEKCLQKSFKALEQMRQREGRGLAADVTDKLKKMRGQIRQIKARSQAVLKEKRQELSVEEFQSFQKGCDVNEEMSRLAHYIDEAGRLLKSSSSAGKKMDFIAQEMQREANTIGSKLQDKIVINAVVALKSKIEKIREQAQNIE